MANILLLYFARLNGPKALRRTIKQSEEEIFDLKKEFVVPGSECPGSFRNADFAQVLVD